ncbi:hypothetical protein A1O3_07529 [Capronia epimyces CBS 606.96]|uniref:Mediator of RNA polymerase II transcription subunit 10 n=1 Tax=Capronia epimyces CBS 606.96 TaxID=1182542 RepID=W9YG17_9EURO|nr:uncharacterized protein A1O3_07529 [Capronia epimyces CBS 606.96]EXJ81239.1 hypothetical protein A1O3_07529 [Capronia epimyces CBS 606.96]
MGPKLLLKMGQGGRGATNTNNNSGPAPPNNGQTRGQRTRSGVRRPVQKPAGDTRIIRTPEDEGAQEQTERPSSTFITIRLTSERLRQVLQSTASSGPFITLKVPRRGRRSAVGKPSSPPEVSGSSPPSLLSGAASTFSEVQSDYGQATPVANEPSPQLYQTYDEQQAVLANCAIIQDPIFSGLLDQAKLLQIPAAECRRATTPDWRVSGQIDSTLDPALYRIAPRHQVMAPVKDTSSVHNTIKDIIQDLTEIQIQTHGYVPETQDLLVDKMTDLAESLSRLQNLTSATASPNNYIQHVQIAPEIVDYVDDGRNPDIFTRDFVENVQRGNAVINGKQQAFKDFSEIYAKALKEGIPGVSRQVDRVLESAGFEIEQKNEGDGPSYSTSNGPHVPDGV